MSETPQKKRSAEAMVAPNAPKKVSKKQAVVIHPRRLFESNSVDDTTESDSAEVAESDDWMSIAFQQRKLSQYDSYTLIMEYICTIGDGLELRESTLGAKAGRGLFADRDFEPDEPITYYYGQRISHAQCHLRNQSHIVSLYDMRASIDGAFHPDGTPIDGDDDMDLLGGAAFANDSRVRGGNNAAFKTIHSVENQRKFDKWIDVRGNMWSLDPEQSQVILYATRAIAKGEEIFVSYGFDYWLYGRDKDYKGLTTVPKEPEVRASLNPKAGMGLFVQRFYKRGECIASLTGRLVPRASLTGIAADYAVHWNRDTALDAIEPTEDSIGHFANSPAGDPLGREANAKFCIDRRNKRVNVRATRNIAPAEEVLVTYGPARTKRLLSSNMDKEELHIE